MAGTNSWSITPIISSPPTINGTMLNYCGGNSRIFKRTPIPFSETDQFYFDFHQRLFILRKIVEQNAQAGVTFYTAATVYHLSDELDDWLKEAFGCVERIRMGKDLTQTSAYLRAQMAIESPKKLHHFRVFTTFWAFRYRGLAMLRKA